MRFFVARLSSLALCVTGVAGAAHPAGAQNTGFSLGMHANSNVSASDLGLPAYPGATLHQRGHDDAAFDLGLTLDGSRYRLRGVNYLSSDTPGRVLAFYRGALSRYGQVLECDHGHAVGEPTRTSSGLTCQDHVSDGGDDRHSTSGHDLRVGSPHNFRLVGVDDATDPTEFILMYIEVPGNS
jgi:hypothetical protein